MKASLIIPPVLSLAIAAGWLGSQRVVISALETETAELRERIRLAGRSSGEAGGRSLATRMKEANAGEDGEIDWKDVAEKLSKSNRGQMPDMRARMELQTILMEMEADELVAELDRIAAMDLSKEARQALEGMLIGALAGKDPQLVLERYMDRVNEDIGGLSWRLSNSFVQWQKEDPGAALAWLDAEIAKGSFESKSLDGKNPARFRFESAAMIGLLSSDPDAARQRALAMPEGQREELFTQGMMSFQLPGKEKAYAELVREVLPEDLRASAYEKPVGHLMKQGGFEKVDELITEIDAGGKELEAIVDHAARQRIQTLGWQGKLDGEAVDEMREWASSQMPERVDAITGEALGSVWGNKTKLVERVGMVERLSDEGAGDDLIVSFVERLPPNAKTAKAVGPLLERIADEGRRQGMIDRLEGNSPEEVTGDE